MASIFALTFNDVQSRAGEQIKFTIKTSSGNILSNYLLTFYQSGVSGTGTIYPYQSTADPLQGNGEWAAIAFVNALQMWYNYSNEFIVERNGKTVTITTIVDGYIFTDVISGISQAAFVDNDVDKPVIKPFNISGFVTTDPDNVCNGFNLLLNTSRDFVKITINNSTQNVNATNSYQSDLLRDTSYVFKFEDSDGNTYKWPSTGALIINSLNVDNFDLNISKSFGAYSLIITDNEPSAIVKEYSIDNVNWQSDKNFTIQASGDYTLYIRDKYRDNYLGCVVTIDFNIPEEPVQISDKKPFVQISKANSIPFIKRESVDNINTFKNVENSFPYEQKFAYLYCDEILFEVNDSTRIQLKSSYDNVDVTLRKNDGTSEVIPVNKRTDNINKFSSMDAVIEFYKTDYAIIYFNSGFYYDENGAQTDSYSLNGNLPEFAVIGAKIEVGVGAGIVTEVEDIVYLDSINKKCLVVPMNYTESTPLSIIIKAEYNILDYNIFDFDIVWNTKGVGIYDVVIDFTDDLLDAVQYQSQNINIADSHPNTIPITYFNTNNRDIFYKYDITHFIRVPVEFIEEVIEDEIENNTTDTNVVVLKSVLNEGQKFYFEEMTRPNLIRLAIALSCEFVFINGVGYSKSGPFELEPFGATNLTKLAATMLINGNKFNNIDEYIQGGLEADINIDVPTFNIRQLIATEPNKNILSSD